jgi:hypothetical protein
LAGHAAQSAKPATYVGALSGVALLWFLGSLRSTLRAGEGGTGRLSSIAFAGGIVLVAGAAVDASLAWAVAESTGGGNTGLRR